MGNVFVDISMSLDGLISGPNDDVEQLHQWGYDLASWRERHGLAGGELGPDSDLLEEAFSNTGAVLMGRRMFDLAEEPWGDEPPFRMPVFVVTHHARETLVKEGGTTFTFITGGIESALQQAQAAAGDQDIAVAGGANIIQQLSSAGLLGDGRRLFEHLGAEPIELERTRVIESPSVTHLRFRVIKEQSS